MEFTIQFCYTALSNLADTCKNFAYPLAVMIPFNLFLTLINRLMLPFTPYDELHRRKEILLTIITRPLHFPAALPGVQA